MSTKAPYSSRRTPRQPRTPRPVDHDRLQELALAYVARFACSAAKLDAYLRRKLRERGWQGEGEPDVAILVERCVRAGYVDDAAYARSKSNSLLHRGYGPRRVDSALNAAGIAEPIREDLRAGEAAQRSAALIMARKRRFGPFGVPPAEPLVARALREKQVAAMLRAGHGMQIVRALMNADSADAAQNWATELDDEDMTQ